MRPCSYDRQMIQALLLLTLISTFGVKCYTINDSEPVLRDLLKSSRLGRLVCPLLLCRGLKGSRLHLCYQERCGGGGQEVGEEDSALSRCVRQQCGSSRQFMREACIFWKCEGGSGAGTFLRKRKWSGDIMWPDEFETRSVDFWPDDFETRSVPMENNALEDDMKDENKAMNRRSKREMEQGRPVNSQGCSGKCHGFTGEKYTACIALACPTHPSKHHVVSVKKRWSTRLCMEAHCQGLASKVDYFLCGKQKCHK